MAKRFTKNQRHKYYKKALAVLKTMPINDMAVCLILDELTGQNYWEVLDRLFPEWYKHQTTDNFDPWWPLTRKGKETRIKILQKCIRLTKPEIK